MPRKSKKHLCLLRERRNTWETSLDACLLLGYDQGFFKVPPSPDRSGKCCFPSLTDRIADYRCPKHFSAWPIDPCTKFCGMFENIHHALEKGLLNLAEV